MICCSKHMCRSGLLTVSTLLVQLQPPGCAPPRPGRTLAAVSCPAPAPPLGPCPSVVPGPGSALPLGPCPGVTPVRLPGSRVAPVRVPRPGVPVPWPRPRGPPRLLARVRAGPPPWPRCPCRALLRPMPLLLVCSPPALCPPLPLARPPPCSGPPPLSAAPPVCLPWRSPWS